MPTGLGDEQLWLSATNDNTGTSTAFDDQSGNGNDGTATGTTVVADTSEGGSYAYDLDGTDDYIDLGQTLDVEYTDEVSYSFWMRADDGVSTFQTVMGKMLSSGTYRGHLVAYRGSAAASSRDNGITFILRSDNNSGKKIEVATTDDITAGQWTHVSVTYDGSVTASGVEVYIDGVQASKHVVEDDQGTQTTVTTAPYNMGSRNTDSAFFEGRFDDMRQYSRVLTQAEITHLSSSRGVEGKPFEGLGDEQLWLSATNDNTGTSSAFQDQSGNGNNGTASGTLVVADTSEGGTYAYDFDGTDDDISTPFADTLTTSTGVFSMACWVKYDSVAATSGLISGDIRTGKIGLSMSFDDFSSDRGHGGLLNPSVSGQYSGRVFAGDRDTVNTGQWYHVAYTGDGSTARIYVDGVEESSAAQTLTTSGAWTHPLRIGSYINNGTVEGYLNGRMDDARVYTRTLTQAEITHLASQRGIEGPAPVGLGDEQLWLCPSLNDSADDISGNGNNGTYEGGMGTVADTDEGGTRAYEFDGSDDSINCGLSTGIGQSSTFSISGWFNADAAGSNSTMLSAHGTQAPYANQRGWLLRSPTVPTWLTNSSSGSSGANRTITSSETLSRNIWFHIVATYDVDTDAMEMFINGVSVATGSSAGTISSPTVPFLIGRYNSNVFNGSADDIRAYNRVLTQAEITHLASQRGVEGPPPVGLGDEVNWLCPSLNEDADITGNAVFGLGSNSIVTDTDSGGSKALSLGTVSTSTLNQSTDEYGGIADMSQTVWLKINTQNAGTTDLCSYGSSSKRNPWAFWNSTYFYFQTDVYSEIDTPTAGDWVHLCFVKSGASQRVYVDGAIADTIACQATTYTNNNGNFVFNNGTAGNFYVDDFRGYTRAITQAEIAHLATSRGIEGPPPTRQEVIDESVTYVPLQETGTSFFCERTGIEGTLTDTNSAGRYVSGPTDFLSNAIKFDSTELRRIAFASVPSDLAGMTKYTVSAWVQGQETATRNRCVVSFEGTASSRSYVLQTHVSASTQKGPSHIHGGSLVVARNVVDNTNQWSHVAVTVDTTTGTRQSYLNGQLDTELTGSPLAAVYATLNYFAIGATTHGGAGNYHDAAIAGVGVWDKILSATQISSLYEGQGYDPPVTPGVFYNPFITHAFEQLFQTRLR